MRGLHFQVAVSAGSSSGRCAQLLRLTVSHEIMHVAFLNLLLLWQHSDNLLPLVKVLLLAEWSTADHDLQ